MKKSKAKKSRSNKNVMEMIKIYGALRGGIV